MLSKPAAKDYAEELGWNISFDLDPAKGVGQAGFRFCTITNSSTR